MQATLVIVIIVVKFGSKVVGHDKTVTLSVGVYMLLLDRWNLNVSRYTTRKSANNNYVYDSEFCCKGLQYL
jgi:hypothetical protein